MTTRPSVKAAKELIDFIADGGTMFDDAYEGLQGATDCEHGCTIEPDAHCAHGWLAAEESTMGLIP